MPWFRRAAPTGDAPTGGRVLEATSEDWFWGRITGAGTEEDLYWRRLSDSWAQKDVLPATYLDIHHQVYEAYNANPMANAIVEMGVNFVLGDGLVVDAAHRKVQALLDAFWSDPDNRMNLRQYDLATELSLYGELFIRVFVNRYNGHVKIAQIDPVLIDEIECDPENIERQLRCHRRPLGAGGDQAAGTAMEEGPLKGVWFDMPDEVMHFAINKVTNAKRGKSDLATLLPWMRRYKDWLIDRVRLNKYRSSFLWDVTLTGADRAMIDRKTNELARPPEPGSVLVHNESEAWKAVQPQIAADDVSADGQAIKLMVAMGAGLPEHYLSEGGNVNRSTAAEMGLPVVKKYQRRQDYVGFMLRSILDRVIAEAQRAGTLPRTIDTSYTIRFPPLQPTAAEHQGIAALRMAQALQIARSLGLISTETASQLFFDAAREEVDVRKELEKVDPLSAHQGAPPARPPADRLAGRADGSLLNASGRGRGGA
jgi:hypothetical protein